MLTQTLSRIDVLLSLHHDLWDRCSKVNYFTGDYPVETSPTLSCSQVLVPGKSGKDILFITQDLDKSTYGTMDILRSERQGRCVRITWIFEPSAKSYRLIGLIKTSPELDLIEQYTPLGDTITVYSNNQTIYPTHKKFK